MNQISLAIPTFNRFELLIECITPVLNDPRVREIVLSDDVSNNGSFEKLLARFDKHDKVKLYRNKTNQDCYRNKRQAVELATSEWVVLFDDDNVITPNYLDTIFRLGAWQPNTIYAPDFAQPSFNYTRFSGKLFNRRNVAAHLSAPHFKCALNTCNYFVNRQEYLVVWNGSVDPNTADSMFMAYNWFNSGRQLYFVPELRYFHRIHAGSHYQRNSKKRGQHLFVRELEVLLARLR